MPFFVGTGTFVAAFDTATAVYFVLRERTAAHGYSEVSKVLKICKYDQGGVPPLHVHTFGTPAKANLSCRSVTYGENGRSEFIFNRVTSAVWEENSGRLFATFTTPE